MFSKRAASIDSSGIRKVFDLAAKMKSPVNLSIGQPDFDAPDAVKQGAHRAIDSRKNSYTQTQGIAELRAKIQAEYGIAALGEKDGLDLFVSSGVSGGLLLSFSVLLDPTDEILVPDPYFCMYRDLALLLNAKPVYYDTYPNFKISAETIERAITPKTKAIIVCSPSNPTGYSLSSDELKEIVEVAKRAGIWVIYDEIYKLFCYDQPHAECLGLYDKSIILGGYSKSHGIPGWRIGYVIAPTAAVAQMIKIQQYSFVCSPSIVQWGMVDGVDLDLTAITADYRRKRDFIYDGLKDRYKVEKPGGAFYIFPEAPGGSGEAFVKTCIENNLLVVPGTVFSRTDSHFRISFAASMETLEKGLEILNSLAKNY